MPKPTQTALLKAGLVACGWKEDNNARTSKYTVYVKDNAGYKYLVGKSGAFRKTTSTVANSRSLTDGKVKKAYIKVGERAESYSSVEQAIEDLNEIAKTL